MNGVPVPEFVEEEFFTKFVKEARNQGVFCLDASEVYERYRKEVWRLWEDGATIQFVVGYAIELNEKDQLDRRGV